MVGEFTRSERVSNPESRRRKILKLVAVVLLACGVALAANNCELNPNEVGVAQSD